MGTWSNHWILMRLRLLVLKVFFSGYVLVLLFFSLIMKVLNSWQPLHNITAEYNSKANFTAHIDTSVNLTLFTPLTNDIKRMQSFWEKDFTKSHARTSKRPELYFNFNYSNTKTLISWLCFLWLLLLLFYIFKTDNFNKIHEHESS